VPHGPSDQARHARLILGRIDALPTLPAIATRLLALVQDDGADLRELIRLIEADPALSSRLLWLCARAASGAPRDITTIPRAVVMLGLDAVRAAALSVHVMDWVGAVGPPRDAARDPAGGEGMVPAFDAPGLWRHSVAVACAAELIARDHPALGLPPGECFLAGLVHDLGKLALAHALPRAYARAAALAEERHANIAHLERAVLGLDHHEAGRRLAQRWNLPPDLAEVIATHGTTPAPALPGGSPTRAHRLTAVVIAANSLCRRLHLGWSGNAALAPDLPEVCRAAGLDAELVEALTPRLHEALAARCADLGLGSAGQPELLLDSVLRANRRLGRLAAALEERTRELARNNESLRAAQRRLAHAESMARLGELTAGAAHEMNSPLAVISARAQWLARAAEGDQPRAAARAIVEAAGRLDSLVARLNSIAVPPAPAFAPVDLVETATAALAEARRRASLAPGLQASAPAVVPAVVHGPPGLRAHADAALLRSALAEVILNALEAMAGRAGSVTITADLSPATAGPRLVVRDRGPGLSPTVLHHAFDPFFSSKPAGRQQGLGLALAKRFIELMGGSIRLAPAAGGGAEAVIELEPAPAAGDAAPRSAA